MSDSDPAVSPVYLRAVSLLARRDHSVAELRRKLLSRGFAAAQVEDVLESLLERGYLDDRRFAEQWAGAALRSGRGVGARLQLELQRRGISRETAAAAVAAAESEQDERQLLNGILAKRFAGFNPTGAPLKERHRVYAYLVRRGFSPETIRACLQGRNDD